MVKPKKRLTEYLGSGVPKIAIKSKAELNALKKDFDNSEYGQFMNSLTPQQKKYFLSEKQKERDEQARIKKQRQDEIQQAKLQKQEELRIRKEQEDDYKAYQEGRVDDIKNSEFRSEAQKERATNQGLQNQEKFDEIKRNSWDNVVNGIYDTALNAIPYVGEAKQAVGLQIGGKIKKFKKNIESGGGLFDLSQEHTNASQNVLKKYGGLTVKQLQLKRTPINSALDSVLNVLSLGKFKQLKNEQGIDKLFHLALIATVNLDGVNKNIVIEKNERISISLNYTITDKTETLDIPLGNRQFTIDFMLNKAIEMQGREKIFLYDPFENNCQFFTSFLLQAVGLYNYQTRAFLFQSPEAFRSKLSNTTKAIAKATTNLGAWVSKMIGAGLTIHRVNVNKDLPFDEAIKHARSILKTKRKFPEKVVKNYFHFKNINKNKFEKGSFRSKKINDNITLVFGKLIE